MPSEYTIALAATIISAILGCLRKGILRTILIAILWLAPLWFALWFTANYAAAIAFEFGAWWVYLSFSLLFLAICSTVTLFPFMLTKRFLEIQRDH
jgi:hypothetical protein